MKTKVEEEIEKNNQININRSCTVLYCTVLYYTVLYCIILYCTVLYCTVLYCTVQCVLYYIILYCTILYSTALYCTVLYCTVLRSKCTYAHTYVLARWACRVSCVFPYLKSSRCSDSTLAEAADSSALPQTVRVRVRA